MRDQQLDLALQHVGRHRHVDVGLADIAVPTLVLVGAEDQPTSSATVVMRRSAGEKSLVVVMSSLRRVSVQGRLRPEFAN